MADHVHNFVRTSPGVVICICGQKTAARLPGERSNQADEFKIVPHHVTGEPIVELRRRGQLMATILAKDEGLRILSKHIHQLSLFEPGGVTVVELTYDAGAPHV